MQSQNAKHMPASGGGRLVRSGVKEERSWGNTKRGVKGTLRC